jgi:hypothetical protein
MIPCVMRVVPRMVSLVLQLIICVTLSSVFLFVAVYETEPINNRIVRMHHEFRFRSSTAAVRTEDEHMSVYMPRCADLRPRPSSRYAVLVEKIGDGHGYFLSALKLGVRLNWYLHAIRNHTDLIMEIVQAAPPRSNDVAVLSALQAGYDRVCHARAIVGGPYTRFVVFNMTQYESVLYIDGDVMPVNDVSELIANGTRELKSAGKQVMWAHERRYDWFNAGVVLVLPDSRVFTKLMRLYEEQMKSGLVRHIGPYIGLDKLNEALLPVKNLMDQAMLNHMFHPHKNRSLSMSDKYNALLYEHTGTSDEVLRYAHLIHFIHTKPWKQPWCYTTYHHGKICDMWFATPTVLD